MDGGKKRIKSELGERIKKNKRYCAPLNDASLFHNLNHTQIRAADWHPGKCWGSSVKNFCLFFTSSRHQCAARKIREAWRDEIGAADVRRCQTVAWESTKGHAHPRQRWNGGRHKGWKLPSCKTYGGNWENDTSSRWMTIRDTHTKPTFKMSL